VESKYSHIYNRGVDKRNIFSSDADRLRFLDTVRFVRLQKSPRLSVHLDQIQSGALEGQEIDRIEQRYGPKIVEILAFALMPNHFHFLIKELEAGGIPKFAQRLGNSYTRFFNTKYKRKGRLFESTYQQVAVVTDEQFMHLSRYIHLNPVMAKRSEMDVDVLISYPWTSCPAYFGKPSDICVPDEVISMFNSRESYKTFLKKEAEARISLSPKLVIDLEE